MDAYVDDSTGEFVDGLVDLIVGILGMPREHQPQPLSQEQVDKYGHVDPTMWTTQEGQEQMTLEEDISEIMRRVQRLHISDASIQDRFVRDTYACMHELHALTTDVMGALRWALLYSAWSRVAGMKSTCTWESVW